MNLDLLAFVSPYINILFKVISGSFEVYQQREVRNERNYLKKFLNNSVGTFVVLHFRVERYKNESYWMVVIKTLLTLVTNVVGHLFTTNRKVSENVNQFISSL